MTEQNHEMIYVGRNKTDAHVDHPYLVRYRVHDICGKTTTNRIIGFFKTFEAARAYACEASAIADVT